MGLKLQYTSDRATKHAGHTQCGSHEETSVYTYTWTHTYRDGSKTLRSNGCRLNSSFNFVVLTYRRKFSKTTIQMSIGATKVMIDFQAKVAIENCLVDSFNAVWNTILLFQSCMFLEIWPLSLSVVHNKNEKMQNLRNYMSILTSRNQIKYFDFLTGVSWFVKVT